MDERSGCAGASALAGQDHDLFVLLMGQGMPVSVVCPCGQDVYTVSLGLSDAMLSAL